MVGAHQNLNGSHDLTTLLSGMVFRLLASTGHSQPVYQIWSRYLHSPQAIQNVENRVVWNFGVVICYSKPLEIAPFDKAHTSSY